MILDLFGQAFVLVDPDPATIAMYDAWSDASFEDELRWQKEDAMESFAKHMKHAYGLDVDPDQLDDDPATFARLAAEAREIHERQQRDRGGSTSTRKKTPRQRQRDEERMLQEEFAARSVRGVYLSLAKVLHPDLIADPVERLRKEELMKRVTAAYQERDLHTLLTLEMEWVRSEHDALEKIPDDTLKLYTAALREQATVLEKERAMLRRDPHFLDLAGIPLHDEAAARRALQKLRSELHTVTSSLERVEKNCAASSPKPAIMSFVNDYIEAQDEFLALQHLLPGFGMY